MSRFFKSAPVDYGSIKYIDSNKREKEVVGNFQLKDGTKKIISVFRKKSKYFNYLTCTSSKKGFSFEYIVEEKVND